MNLEFSVKLFYVVYENVTYSDDTCLGGDESEISVF
jgi:hypothetical protein